MKEWTHTPRRRVLAQAKDWVCSTCGKGLKYYWTACPTCGTERPKE